MQSWKVHPIGDTNICSQQCNIFICLCTTGHRPTERTENEKPVWVFDQLSIKYKLVHTKEYRPRYTCTLLPLSTVFSSAMNEDIVIHELFHSYWAISFSNNDHQFETSLLVLFSIRRIHEYILSIDIIRKNKFPFQWMEWSIIHFALSCHQLSSSKSSNQRASLANGERSCRDFSRKRN